MRRFFSVFVIAGSAMWALAGCQNLAGQPGVDPANCAVPGSSCSRDGGGR
jgi:hypothetical protein